MSAAGDLWKQSTAQFAAVIERYWLLAARPNEYFDKYIRDKKAKDLRRVIRHSLLAVAAVTLVCGATFGFKAFAGTVPALVQLVLTKQYLLFILTLVATTPALLLFYGVYRVIGASPSELMFIYFSVITLWIILIFVMLVSWIVVGLVFLPFNLFFSKPLYVSGPTFWIYAILILIVTSTILSACYYVPMVLLERSTGRSSLFASALCVAALTICTTLDLAALEVTGTLHPFAAFVPQQPQEVIWCTKNDNTTPDLTIAGCTLMIGSARYYDDELAMAFVNRGNAYANKEEYDLAIADYGEAIKRDPAHAEAFNNRGLAYADKEEYDLAIADYGEAIKRDPAFAEAFNNRGLAYHKKKDYDLAIADYGEAIKHDPAFAKAFNNRGLAYAHKEEYDLAIADYGEAIKRDPAWAGAFNNRGLAYEKQNHYDLAIADYSEAIRLDPNLIGPLLNRGVLYSKKKYYDRAIDDYSAVMKLDPNHADAYYNRGVAYKAQGNVKQANADFATAKRLHK